MLKLESDCWRKAVGFQPSDFLDMLKIHILFLLFQSRSSSLSLNTTASTLSCPAVPGHQTHFLTGRDSPFHLLNLLWQSLKWHFNLCKCGLIADCLAFGLFGENFFAFSHWQYHRFKPVGFLLISRHFEKWLFGAIDITQRRSSISTKIALCHALICYVMCG